jgi:hypothetical protein
MLYREVIAVFLRTVLSTEIHSVGRTWNILMLNLVVRKTTIRFYRVKLTSRPVRYSHWLRTWLKNTLLQLVDEFWKSVPYSGMMLIWASVTGP